MGDHKYKYQIKLDEKDKQNIVKGLFKIIEEKAKGIIEVCADGRIDGQVYDSETEALNLLLIDLENISDTLTLLKNVKEAEDE